MKFAAVLTMTFLAVNSAFAETETLVRDVTTSVAVELNQKTVKCSKADYSLPMLKVLVPALADLTVLNHRNTREGAPCVSAGPCKVIRPGEVPMTPSDLLKDRPGTDTVDFRVVLKRISAKEQHTCFMYLKEEVFAIIRGVPFYHEQTEVLPERKPDDCP